MARLLYQGHGSYRIVSEEGMVIYVDPFAGEGYDLEADLILITHEHFDHTKTELVTLKKDGQVLRAKDFLGTDGHKSVDVKGVHIQAVPAYNENHPIDECVGYVITVDGKKIYGAGDTSETGYMTSHLSKMELDFALLPMDGKYNMDCGEASKCASIIGAKHTIPVHMVPDAIELFDLERAYQLKCKGRLVVSAGKEINLDNNAGEVVTCQEMKILEKEAAESGLSYRKMMENAGAAATDEIVKYLESKGVAKNMADVVVFCGKGNNGGDGYVVAKLLAAMGVSVTVVQAAGIPKTEDAIANANIVLRRGTPTIDAKAYFDELPEIVEAADVLVDAMFGTGFQGELVKEAKKCAKLINSEHQAAVFALDIPSGLNGDEGQPSEDTVKADYTVVFHKKKPVHELKEAKEYCGKIIVADIGIAY